MFSKLHAGKFWSQVKLEIHNVTKLGRYLVRWGRWWINRVENFVWLSIIFAKVAPNLYCTSYPNPNSSTNKVLNLDPRAKFGQIFWGGIFKFWRWHFNSLVLSMNISDFQEDISVMKDFLLHTEQALALSSALSSESRLST